MDHDEDPPRQSGFILAWLGFAALLNDDSDEHTTNILTDSSRSASAADMWEILIHCQTNGFYTLISLGSGVPVNEYTHKL